MTQQKIITEPGFLRKRIEGGRLIGFGVCGFSDFRPMGYEVFWLAFQYITPWKGSDTKIRNWCCLPPS